MLSVEILFSHLEQTWRGREREREKAVGEDQRKEAELEAA